MLCVIVDYKLYNVLKILYLSNIHIFKMKNFLFAFITLTVSNLKKYVINLNKRLGK